MPKNGKLCFTDNTDDGEAQVAGWITEAKRLPNHTQRGFLLAVWSGASMPAARKRYGLTFSQAMGLMAIDSQTDKKEEMA